MEKIIIDLIAKYRSLRNPDYSFVSRVYQAEIYKKVIESLSGFFEIQDMTDINDDVSFVYVISSTETEWILMLSMVGRYAALFRKDPVMEYVYFDETTKKQEEELIFSVLKQEEFLFLEEEILAAKVPLSTDGLSNETFFYFLFGEPNPF